jgi:cytochrome b involved in lipid metabolism
MVNFKLARGPNSLMGVAATPEARDGAYVNKQTLRAREEGAIPLRVVPLEKLPADGAPRDVALLHPECALASEVSGSRGHLPAVLLTLEAGSDCVLRAAGHPAVPRGCLALNEEMRYNVHVAEDQTAAFKAFAPTDDERRPLWGVDLEVRLLRGERATTSVDGDGDGDGDGEGDGDGDGDVVDDSSEDTDDDSSSSDSSSSEASDASAMTAAAASSSSVTVDGAALASALAERLSGRWVSVGELFSATDPSSGRHVRVRVAGVDVLPPAESVVAVGHHCFRGVVDARTAVFLHAEGDDRSGTTVGGGARVTGSRSRRDADGAEEAAAAAAAETVTVTTSDGEAFPVHRSLLRPCIALTRAIREAAPEGAASSGKRAEWEKAARRRREGDSDGDSDSNDSNARPDPPRVPATAEVDVDCAGFDRALAWLEAESLGRAHPEYDIRVVESMAATAETLGLRSLADACAARLGTHASRVRVRRWADITAHNDAGGAWLVVDGMVLDVKRWLPEHPGGDKIIPAQSLNAEAARHFELYHSSRESFLYLKHFYVGEVFADDRASVPLVPGPPASDDFLQQLREYTDDFRVVADELPEEEENVRAHLGARGAMR